MLDINFIRDNQQLIQDSADARGDKVNISELLKIDQDRRQAIEQADELRAERNKIAASMKGGKPDPETIAAGKAVKEQLVGAEERLAKIQSNFRSLMLAVPNILHDSVGRGLGESANTVIKTVGDKPEFDFEVKDHEELGLALDLLDLEAGAEVSGSRFYFLKNGAVRLEYALINWLIEKYVSKGFSPVTTPMMVKEHMMEATGFFPIGEDGSYRVNPDTDDLYLVGTSEVALAGLHINRPLAEADLAKRYIGISSCFRREAGSYGKDTKGIFRVHQFEKVEMYSYCHPDKSWEEHDYLLSVEEEILQELGLHYQVINIGSGDLGAPAAKKYDCEVWIPSQEKYRELTSCSNTTDFQSRRAGLKYKDSDGQLKLTHTLNGTAMASTRTIIAIMENNQTADGNIKVPEVLKKYFDQDYL